MASYESLGVRRVINASARLTRLGGSLMPEPVKAAMMEASLSYVDVFELQRVVGRRIAELTNNEASYVTTGASAGLFVTTLACMTGSDLKAISRLPNLDGLKNEVIIHRNHRIPYDPAVQLAGAKLVEIGNRSQTFPWEFEAVLSERTAAVFYVAGTHVKDGVLPLPQVIEMAHAHGVPVIVDAADQLPPLENLWYFTRDLGADLAVFSGGKDLQGPQASGLVVGRQELIDACFENGAPHQRLGRPMKVGKEEMMGLLAAIERYVSIDHAARIAGWEAIVQDWVVAFNQFPGVAASRSFPGVVGRPLPRLLVQFDSAVAGVSGAEVQDRLWEGDPRIAVASESGGGIFIAPDTLEPGDERIITERLSEILQSTTATVSADD